MPRSYSPFDDSQDYYESVATQFPWRNIQLPKRKGQKVPETRTNAPDLIEKVETWCMEHPLLFIGINLVITVVLGTTLR